MTPDNAVTLKGERMLSVRETAKIMGWCLDSVRRHLRSGQMPGVRLGRNWRVPESQLAAYIGLGKSEFDTPVVSTGSYTPAPGRPKTTVAATQSEGDSEIIEALLRTSAMRSQVLQLVQTAMKNTDASPEVAQQTLKELNILLRHL
jgi:excisionase family DNA binding protein